VKWASKLTDEELTELYKLFMCNDDKFVDLNITRYDDDIFLEGHIRIPESDEDYADEDGMCEVDEDYVVTDFYAKARYHSGNVNKEYRSYMYKKFGYKYAKDYLFSC